MDKQIYREEILEHYRNPQNFCKLKKVTEYASLSNPLCGDSLTVYVCIEKSRIGEVSFQGEGCAISIAAASILSGAIKGKKVKTVLMMSKERVLKTLNLKLTPVRQKCALLFFEALTVAISKVK